MAKVHGNDPTGYGYAEADALKAAARGLAQTIGDGAPTRSAAVTTASRQFRGYFADVFARNADIASRSATRLQDALRQLVGFVDQLEQAAREEDRRRADARAWEQRKREREENFFVGAAHEVSTWFGAEDDPKPPEPKPEPRLRSEQVDVRGRTIPSAGGGSGSTSSAVPADLRSFATSTRGADTPVAGAVTAFSRALADYDSSCNTAWGSLDGQSLRTAVGDWATENGQDASWADTVAAQFEAAGAGTGPATLSDASIAAALAAAGVDVTREDFTIGPFSAMGTPPTNGYADDPVNTATGNFLEPEDDVTFPGAAASLRFSRMYNSTDTRTGWFGPGWSSVLDVRLELGTDVASFVLEDGRQVDFPRAATGWARAVDEDLWLVAESAPDGVPAVVGAPTALRVHDNAGRWWTFTASGQWTGTGRGTGTAVMVRRDDAGRIAAVEHELGRWIAVEYRDDRVVGLRASDGRTVEYRYEDGRLSAVADPVGVRAYRWNEAGLIDRVTAATGVIECENEYDTRGRVTAQRTPFGRLVRFAYLPGRVTSVSGVDGQNANTWIADRRGRVVGIVDADGSRQSMAYDARGHLVSVIGRDGAVTVHVYDDRGRRTRTVTPQGADVTYGHDEQDRITTVVAEDGGVVSYSYRGDDRNPSVVVDTVGGRTTLDWRGALLTSCTDPTGVTIRFHHDDHGELTGVENAEGNTASFVRDAAGRVVEATTPLGHRTLYRYDGAGLLVSREDPDGGIWRFEHDHSGRVVATTDPTGARTAVEYGRHGEVVATTDPLGRLVRKDFDELGNPVSMTLPDGAEWRFVHDALSRLRAVIDPAGGTWSREYDALGVLAATTDPTGVRTVSEQPRTTGAATVRTAFEDVTVHTDSFGRPVRVDESDGSSALTVRDAAGRVVESVDAEGGLTRIDRDLAGRVVGVTTPEGRRTHYEYDRCGRPSASTDPLGGRTELTYDADSRIVARSSADGTVASTEYDAMGRVTRTDVPGLGVARYRYDRAGRVVSVQDPRFGRRSLRYDAAGQLVAAVNGLGGVTRYEYDQRGRLVSTTNPVGTVTTRTYTQLDKVASITDPLGRTTTATYDGAGRQLTQTGADGVVLRWEYDAAGRETAQYNGDDLLARIERHARTRTATITDHTGPGAPVVHSLEFDRLGHLVRRDTGGRETRWTHDADGLRVAMSSPDGSTVRYARDAAGRVTAVEHSAFGIVRYEYDDGGALRSLRAADSEQAWLREHGFVTEHVRTTAGVVDVTRITRDGSGRITRIDGPTGTTTYEHDDAGQLVAAHAGRVTSEWAYDPAGHLVSERVDGRVRQFEHDAAGQLVRVVDDGAVTEHQYDRRGQRVRTSHSDGLTTAFSWEPRGWLNRVSRRGEDTAVHVDALGEVATLEGVRVEWDTAAALPSPLSVGGRPVARAPGGLLGVDGGWTATGWREARASTDEDPWALLAAVAGEVGAVPLGPDGSLLVSELEWMGARAYDASTRSFLSVDPLTPPPGAAWGSNPYSFAGNDPLQAVDPLGLAPITDAELDAYAAAQQGPLARAAAATGDWFKDNWEYVAGGAMVVAGGVLMATGVGGPVGAMLLSAGIDTVVQKATTGEVNWGQVAVSGAFGAVGGGAGSVIARQLIRKSAENGVEGAAENVANAVVSGKPLTPAGLVGTAVEGATTSVVTGGALSKVHLPGAAKKLGDEIPTPFEGQKIYRVYGEDAQATGASWSPSHPGSVADYRDIAGLPSGKAESGYSTNSGQYLLEGTLRDPSAVVKTRAALPLDGNPGGLPEYIIPQGIEKGAIQLDRVSGINPEF